MTVSSPATAPEGEIWAFLDFELDPARRELRRGACPVPLQPKAFDLLVFLVRNRDRAVGRDELLEKLWPGEFVSDSALSFSIKAVRRALGDDGSSRRIIRTIHGFGFAFVAELRPLDEGNAPPLPPSPARRDARMRVLLQTAEAPFVGREAERQRLRSELDRTLAGEVRSVFLVGEPGIGKTRLAAELAVEAEERGAEVLVGRCTEGPAPAFWPWVHVLRSYVERHETAEVMAAFGPGAADVAQILPDLARVPRGAAPAIDPEHARLRLFDSIAGFLGRATRPRPLVVVLDDLHWADASTLLVLRHVVRELQTAPLLLVGTYRDSEVRAGDPLAELLSWLHRTRRSARCHLPALDDDEAERLARALLDDETADSAIADLCRVSEGNPFFVEEFCRNVRDAGPDVRRTPAIPEGVRQLLDRRIARAGEDAARLLSVAAVIGRDFDVDLLVTVSGAGREAVLAGLDRAVEAGLLHEDHEAVGRYAFGHALLRDVAYESASRLRRCGIHQRVGEALERSPGGDPLLRAATLAHHFAEAAPTGDVDRAVGHCERAATAHLETLGYEEACRWYERALEIGRRSLDERRRFDLLLALAGAARRAGDGNRARDASFEAAENARARGAVVDLARAALGAKTMSPTPSAERVALLEEAVEALRDSGSTDRGLLARLLAALASTLYGGDRDAARSIALIEDALRLARAVGDRRTLLSVLRAAQVVYWRPDGLDERLALGTEHLSAVEPGDPSATLAARGWYVDALVEAGRIREAFEQIERHQEEATETRLRSFLGNAESFAAMRAFLECRLEDAERSAHAAFAFSNPTDPGASAATFWAQMYYVRREQNRLSEIEAGIESFAADGLDLSWDWLRIHLWSETGRLEEAATGVRRLSAAGFAQGLPPPRHIARIGALYGLAEATATTREAGVARALRETLAPWAGRWARFALAGICLGPVETALGLVADVAGDRKGALAHLERAEEAAGREGATLPRLRARLARGRLLAASRTAAERQRGARMLGEVLARARENGLENVARRAEAARG